jgi:hypothetical protein
VLAEMAGDGAGVEIVRAANAVADIEIEIPAFVEIRRRLRIGEGRWRKREERGGNAALPKLKTHHPLLDAVVRYC